MNKNNLTREQVSKFLSRFLFDTNGMKKTVASKAGVTDVQVAHALGHGSVSNKTFIKIAYAMGFCMEIKETIKGKTFSIKQL